MEMLYKTYPFAVKEIAERTLEFVGSTEDIDRDGEVVEVAGWKLDNYMKNPVFMWVHDYKEPPIGKALKVWKRDGQLKFNIEFAPKETYEFADTIYKLYKGGFLNATSVGFIPDLDSIVEGDGIKTPRKTYKKQELLELSGVPIPSQVNALRNAIDSGVITTKEFEVITKPEETSEFIRIPVDNGNHDGHRIRTIEISANEGISALYCGTDKVIMTYLFDKSKGWDMAKAKAWVKEHEKSIVISTVTNSVNDDEKIEVYFQPSEIILHSPRARRTTQEEIIDEIDYLESLIDKEGLSDKAKESLKKLTKRFPADDIAVKDKPTVKEIVTVKETLTNLDILESIKRIGGK